VIKTTKIREAASHEVPTEPHDSEVIPDLLWGHMASPHEGFTSPRVPRYRSDLAFASGFVALACIFFRFSLIPLIFDLKHSEAISDVVFFLALPLPGLPAPLALWLGIAAWSDLKHHPLKSGKLPGALGLIIGSLGTLIVLFEIGQVVRVLAASY
jgi:hypothetical protein